MNDFLSSFLSFEDIEILSINENTYDIGGIFKLFLSDIKGRSIH